MEQKLISVDVLKNKIFTWFHKDSQESNELDDLAASVIMEIDSMPAIDPVHAAGGCYCGECSHKNTSACPAYDAPMNRTSLRIDFCNCGEKKEGSDNG